MRVHKVSHEIDKSRIATEILDYLNTHKYQPDRAAQYIFKIWLDEKIYLSDDQPFCDNIDKLSGMDAGDEFTFTKEEIIEMLTPYITPTT